MLVLCSASVYDYANQILAKLEGNQRENVNHNDAQKVPQAANISRLQCHYLRGKELFFFTTYTFKFAKILHCQLLTVWRVYCHIMTMNVS